MPISVKTLLKDFFMEPLAFPKQLIRQPTKDYTNKSEWVLFAVFYSLRNTEVDTK